MTSPQHRHHEVHDKVAVGEAVVNMDFKAHTYVPIKAGTPVCNHTGYVSVMIVCISWRTETNGPLHTKTKFYMGPCVVGMEKDKETGYGLVAGIGANSLCYFLATILSGFP